MAVIPFLSGSALGETDEGRTHIDPVCTISWPPSCEGAKALWRTSHSPDGIKHLVFIDDVRMFCGADVPNSPGFSGVGKPEMPESSANPRNHPRWGLRPVPSARRRGNLKGEAVDSTAMGRVSEVTLRYFFRRRPSLWPCGGPAGSRGPARPGGWSPRRSHRRQNIRKNVRQFSRKSPLGISYRPSEFRESISCLTFFSSVTYHRSRSKLEDTRMSMDGDRVTVPGAAAGRTRRCGGIRQHLIGIGGADQTARGRPSSFARNPAKMSPKFPVGTEKFTVSPI